MPVSAPKHCPHGHPPYHGARCPVCVAQGKARAEASRPSSGARGYNGEWRKARADFLAGHPVCASCAAPATVVDHIIAHKGDPKLFWDRSNWQPLCVPCHNRKTVRLDGGFGVGSRQGVGGRSEFAGKAPKPTDQPRAQSHDKWDFWS